MSRKCADKAHEEWWEAKVKEAERLHEAAVRLSHGGSLLKDLRLLRYGLKLRVDSKLLAQNGTHLQSTADKLERWQEHFAQVSSVLVKVVMHVLNSVLETTPLFLPEPDRSAALSAMPSEGEARGL